MFPHLFTNLSLAAIFSTLAAAPTASAQGTMADDFAHRQDFSTSPPTLGFSLDDMIQWSRPNRSYDHTGGAPYPGPRPYYLPSGLSSIFLRSKTISYQTSTSPRCVKTSREFYVTMVFTDGSRYSFEDIEVTEKCSDGSYTSFQKRYQIPELGPPGHRDWLVRVESWTSENLGTRKHNVRGAGSAAASYTNRVGVPVVTSGPLTIDMAPGGVLDLRQNAAAAGPIFTTDGPVTLRCDTILMDPGVVLADLFSPPPILLPGAVIADAELVGNALRIDPHSPPPFQQDLLFINTGNTGNQLLVSWAGGFTIPGQTVVPISMGTTPTAMVQLVLWQLMPPGTPVGTADHLQVQVTSQTVAGLQIQRTLPVVFDHAGQFHYGAGTPGNHGPHAVATDGPLEVGGPSVTVSSVGADPASIGLAMLGLPVNLNYGTWFLPGFPTELYIDPQGFLFVTAVLVADSGGVTTFPLQIANSPGLRGLKVDFQSIHLLTSVQAPYQLSSTPALSMTVQ